MKILVNFDPLDVRADDSDDLFELNVVAPGGRGSWEMLHCALRIDDVGKVENGYAWLTVDWLREQAAPSPEFDQMIAFAQSHGWISADGRLVRAHVEWAPSPLLAPLSSLIAPLEITFADPVSDHPGSAPVSSTEYRRVLGHFATGVSVVTGLDDQEPVGFTCQSMTALSLDPPLILICPAKTSTRDVEWSPAPHSGVPLLRGVMGWLECKIDRVLEGGDHWIVTARVLDLDAHEANPLTFFRGKLSQSELQPVT